MAPENVTGLPEDTSQTVPTEPAATDATAPTEPVEEGTARSDVRPDPIDLVLQRLDDIENRLEYRDRIFDRWGNEVGAARREIAELRTRAATPPRDPERDRREYEADPPGFIARLIDEKMNSGNGHRGAEPATAVNANDEEMRRAISEGEQRFKDRHPDWEAHEDRMAQLLRRDDNRVYDRQGNLNAYATFRKAYLEAKNDAERQGRLEGQGVRATTRAEQDRAKSAARVAGVTAAGTERALPKDLSPESLRGKSVAELEELGRRYGVLSATDPPTRKR